MTTQQINTTFSINDVAYFALFATGRIYAVQVTDVYLGNVSGTTTVMYDLLRLDKNLVIQGIPQDQVQSFSQAKTSLINYLNAQLTLVTNMTAPSV